MWEYTRVRGVVVDSMDNLILQLNAHGSLGWEAFGLDGVHVLMRRKVLDWPPHVGGPGWAPDPTGRFVQRYWDGLRWTEHVTAADRSTTTDFPNRR